MVCKSTPKEEEVKLFFFGGIRRVDEYEVSIMESRRAQS